MSNWGNKNLENAAVWSLFSDEVNRALVAEQEHQSVVQASTTVHYLSSMVDLFTSTKAKNKETGYSSFLSYNYMYDKLTGHSQGKLVIKEVGAD